MQRQREIKDFLYRSDQERIIICQIHWKVVFFFFFLLRSVFIGKWDCGWRLKCDQWLISVGLQIRQLLVWLISDFGVENWKLWLSRPAHDEHALTVGQHLSSTRPWPTYHVSRLSIQNLGGWDPRNIHTPTNNPSHMPNHYSFFFF